MVKRVSLDALILAVLPWGLAVGGGLFHLYRYENAPSREAVAPLQWPAGARLVQAADHPTLLLFVHPKCPCTNATIGELERLAPHLRGRVLTYVVFLHPNGVSADWHRTPLWTRAHAIPGAHVVDDLGSAVTRRFGVTTSGQALLYDNSGQLRFTGGITRARGHSGDNAGSDAILSLASSVVSSPGTSPQCCPVFGCPLFESTDPASTAETKP